MFIDQFPEHQRQDVIDRFEKKIRHDKRTKCHMWNGQILNGYGRFNVHKNGKTVNIHAHILAYELEYGERPKGVYLKHTCDNRACVNVEHLYTFQTQPNTPPEITLKQFVIQKINKFTNWIYS